MSVCADLLGVTSMSSRPRLPIRALFLRPVQAAVTVFAFQQRLVVVTVVVVEVVDIHRTRPVLNVILDYERLLIIIHLLFSVLVAIMRGKRNVNRKNIFIL